MNGLLRFLNSQALLTKYFLILSAGLGYDVRFIESSEKSNFQ